MAAGTFTDSEERFCFVLIVTV